MDTWPLHRLIDFFLDGGEACGGASAVGGSSCSYTDSRVCFAPCTVQVNMSRNATVHGQDPIRPMASQVGLV